MKIRILFALSSGLCFMGCRQAPEVGIKEVPIDIIASVPCTTLYSRIIELLPEHVRTKEQVLFSDSVQKKIVMVKESDVFVTYISEGAKYKNTFGWYSYDKSSPPLSSSSLTLNVLFPDVSNTVLTSGNRLKIGRFKEGTVIGFFLIINGWHNGEIDYDQPKIYTDYAFNVEGYQQHILFEEKTCGDIVLAFEDLAVDSVSDRDFNDMLFTVSDNNAEKVNTAFDKTRIVGW